MDRAPAVEQSKLPKGILSCFLGVGVLMLLSLIVGLFDNTTELSPDHDSVLHACFAIAGLSGLAFGAVAIRDSKGIPVWRRASLAFVLSFLGFLSVFLASSRTANIVEGLIDFPPGETKSYTKLLSISRAYQTRGKGRSWHMQTTPMWSDLEITEDDYEFMLTHQRAGDNTRNPDEIPSRGYFCAEVTLQQAGNALRVMHAGSQKLPRGSVVICPSSTWR